MKIYLASKSPRRKQLLEESGFNFEVVALDVKEDYPPSLDIFEIPEFLARKKAMAFDVPLTKNEVVMAADVVVILGDEILEKPIDKADAKRMIKSMSGKSHTVRSGVCIRSREIVKSFSVNTTVHFGKLSEEEINYYVETYKPYDKAGSYGIQEWIGHCKVKRLEGSYTNVMGLPMYELYLELADFVEN